ncbi:hypothetical protein BST83_09800 [Polaribacter filamentus]|uniref:DUF5777 domain-containing protein n=1 Tax=Polaribacter filamentus TaxID=53483 RepID=A0A2S7KXM9_9FLAO|nr:DUF5777 family beta-barrel protein [Polaribacter filamentus]PQB07422.1 hypothetical protein BST83_09800 [Polaribacter filamentus]
MIKKFLGLLFVGLSLQLSAQDLFDVLEDEAPKTTEAVTATFKGTRIANGHSIENRKNKELEFIISHRFGRVNTGFYDLFGLDQSNIRFALEYGITDDLTAGLGRSSFEKIYDGFLKYKLVKQKTGAKSFPIAISLFGSATIKTQESFDPNFDPSFSERLAYVGQVLIARKFSPSLSLQLTPTFVHRNSVVLDADPHDIFALGFGGRVKLGKRVSLNAEYYYAFDELESLTTTNSLAFGVDIETGGHVFQIILSNSITMIEKSFITETTGNFFGGDIHLGFNISRTF